MDNQGYDKKMSDLPSKPPFGEDWSHWLCSHCGQNNAEYRDKCLDCGRDKNAKTKRRGGRIQDD